MGKGNLSPDFGSGNYLVVILYHGLFLKYLLHPSDGGASLGKHVDGIAAGKHGPDQHVDILVKGHETPQGDFPGQGKIAAVDQGDQAAETDDHVEQGHDDSLQAHHSQVFVHGILIRFQKTVHLGPLLDKGLDHPHPRKALLHIVGEIGDSLLPGFILGVHDFSIINFPHTDQDHGNQGKEGQAHIDVDHHLCDHHNGHHSGVKDADHRRPDGHADHI